MDVTEEQEQSMKLEDFQAKSAVRGVPADSLVTVVSVQRFGSEALELTYKTPTGKVANELLYRDDESRLEIVEAGRPWSFDGDGALFRLVSEALRIRLAHLFDPVLAVRTSVVEPLPQQKLQAPDCRWDLVGCNEAHKMSATFFGGEVKYTKRYRLGQLLSGLTRHFLLMSATPHNGKEEDFQLFMALIDGDRFEGRFRDGVHVADVSDLMRRMVKESLLKFDGKPLFPERIAYTFPYRLSDAETRLYNALVQCWPEITRLAREEQKPEAEQTTVFTGEER